MVTLASNLDTIDDLLDGTTLITGIDINSGSIDGTAIGANLASTGKFTTLNVSTGLAADQIKTVLILLHLLMPT